MQMKESKLKSVYCSFTKYKLNKRRRMWGSHSSGYEDSIFWDIMLCSPSQVTRRFEGICRLELQVRKISQGRNLHRESNKRRLTFNEIYSRRENFLVNGGFLRCVLLKCLESNPGATVCRHNLRNRNTWFMYEISRRYAVQWWLFVLPYSASRNLDFAHRLL
jgi:hypothetical protein